jgi:hypothetical protein
VPCNLFSVCNIHPQKESPRKLRKLGHHTLRHKLHPRMFYQLTTFSSDFSMKKEQLRIVNHEVIHDEEQKFEEKSDF